MNHKNPFFPRHTFLFKGGEAPAAVAPPAPTPPPAAAPLPVAAPDSPPASTSSIEVTQAKLDAKRQAKARQGINSTILAEAGGGSQGDTLGGGNRKGFTLLGGG